MLKKTIFQQVQKERNALAVEKKVSLFNRFRIYLLFNKVIRQLHLRRLIVNRNSKDDNDYVYKEVMGMSDEEIAALEKEQIIGGDEYISDSFF